MSNGSDKRHKALGRGLSALLPPRPAASPGAPPQATQLNVATEAILPNPLQPRTVFQPERLEELAASIRANGIIQPLIVRRHGDAFQIVAGERRLRAAKLAGLKEVPVLVQEVADPRMLELALIENIQREDLNAIEMASAYERLGREYHLSQEDIGRRTGKDRASIANMIRLLRLPKEVQLLLAENRLSTGHARALLTLDSPAKQIELAEKAVDLGYSVRQMEAAVQGTTLDPLRPRGGPRRDAPQDPNVRAAAEELERVLGTRVRILELSEQRGRIEIEYYSQEDLERVFQHITREK
jgi:ParB family transcriptional regulator, chromosome partitioning protein